MEVRLDDDHLNNICATLYSVCCVGKSHLSTSEAMWSQEAAQPETLETSEEQVCGTLEWDSLVTVVSPERKIQVIQSDNDCYRNQKPTLYV
jgi:hypothetical protein